MPLLFVYKAGGRRIAAVAQPGDSIHGLSTPNEISTSSTACVPPTPNLASGPPGRLDLCALDIECNETPLCWTYGLFISHQRPPDSRFSSCLRDECSSDGAYSAPLCVAVALGADVFRGPGTL